MGNNRTFFRAPKNRGRLWDFGVGIEVPGLKSVV